MNQRTWNDFIKENPPAFGAFLQSWEWGEFQKSLGRRVERIFDEKGLLATAIQTELPFGQYYWNIPKGPLGNQDMPKLLGSIREQLPDGAFLRIEPKEKPGGVKAVDRSPATTAIIDLAQTEEEILAGMKSKTRYNVRLAERKGVECKIVGLDRFDDFIRLMEQTTVRDKFRAHPSQYYRSMLEQLQGGDVKSFLAMAFFDGSPIAANFIIDFQGTRTYLHGATSNLHRNVMAQYALHSFLMTDAKNKRMDKFDFWGVAPEGADENHHWYGITRYKRGFGGKEINMVGTYDIPTKQLWYAAYRLAQKMRGR